MKHFPPKEKKKALFFQINQKKSKQKLKIREDYVRKCGSWNTRFILVSVALTEKRLVVSDNTRPVMSKTCLEFGVFCDVNQNLNWPLHLS